MFKSHVGKIIADDRANIEAGYWEFWDKSSLNPGIKTYLAVALVPCSLVTKYKCGDPIENMTHMLEYHNLNFAGPVGIPTEAVKSKDNNY